MPVARRRTAGWFCSENAEEQLENVGTMYLPQGVGGNAYPLLKGRPVIAMEQCPKLGLVGDIVLADLQHYVIVESGIQQMLSVDFKFDTDEAAFRFVLRVDGAPAFSSPITSFSDPTTTRSPFVTLAAR